MPTTKNALLRYQILDRCFSDFSRRYTFEDLLDEVNDKLYDLTGKTTSVRTLREDIKYLGDRMSYNAPIRSIPFDGRKCYYRYASPNYSIFNNELSVQEVNRLASVIDMLGRYRGNDNYAWVEEVINSLECRFGLKGNTERLVSFESNDQLKGLHFLSDVIDATIGHQTLELTYHSFRGPERHYVFSPHYVKQYNNRWFVFGIVEGRTDVTTLALDRFVNLKPSGRPFIQNNTIVYDEYFDDILGVTKLSEYEKDDIILRFSASRFPYIISKPIHKTQQVLSHEDHTILLPLRFNSELEAQIFYFGPEVEVISPQWLRDRIAEKARQTAEKYSIVQKDCTINQ